MVWRGFLSPTLIVLLVCIRSNFCYCPSFYIGWDMLWRISLIKSAFCDSRLWRSLFWLLRRQGAQGWPAIISKRFNKASQGLNMPQAEIKNVMSTLRAHSQLCTNTGLRETQGNDKISGGFGRNRAGNHWASLWSECTLGQLQRIKNLTLKHDRCCATLSPSETSHLTILLKFFHSKWSGIRCYIILAYRKKLASICVARGILQCNV